MALFSNPQKEYEKGMKYIGKILETHSNQYLSKAINCLEKASDGGVIEATYRLAVYYSNGNFEYNYFKVKKTNRNYMYGTALKYLKKAVEAGYRDALYYYGMDLIAVNRNVEGINWLKKAHDAGYESAWYDLVKCYDENKNFKECLELLERYNKHYKYDWEYNELLLKMYKELNKKKEYKETLELLLNKEEKAHYLNALATLYQEEKNYELAVSLYKKANKYNNIDVLRNLKTLAKSNKGITPEEYFEHLEKILYPIINMNISYIHYDANDPYLEDRFNNLFNKFTNDYYSWILGQCGICYLDGFGVKKDDTKAFAFLYAALDKLRKDAEIRYYVGDCYYYGIGVNVNYKEAIFQYEYGDVYNKNFISINRDEQMGDCYYRLKQYNKAILKLEKSMDPRAFHQLGLCYYNGWGIKQQKSKGITLLEKCIELNYIPAMEDLLTLYDKGILSGVTSFYGKKYELYTKLESLTHEPKYQYAVGTKYELGIKVEKNLEQAIYWYELAAKQGYEQAIEKLNKLNEIVEKPKDPVDEIKRITDSINESVEIIKNATKKLKEEPKVEEKVINYEKSAKEELEQLIGLESVKKEIKSIEDVIKVNKIRKMRGLPEIKISKNMVFTGNPGTGKTTVARIVANIFKENGMLEKGQLIETDRAGLVEGYIGQTALKTKKVIESAIGGVLFIDEVYLLAQDDSGKDFGHEAIGILIKMMEDHQDDLVVIVAGYKDEMKRFIDSNSGIKSRFSTYIDFPDYTKEELQEIFQRLATKDQYIISDDAKEKLMKLWEASYKYKKLGNGRAVRNVYQKTQQRYSSRIIESSITDGDLLVTIIADDIPNENEVFH